MVSHILSILNIQEVQIYLWTDSIVTYTWISHHPSRWKDFVHNRVVFIQENLPQAHWRFIPGCDNPADLATRGLNPSQLNEHPEWWKGPKWLSQPSNAWPKNP